MRHDWTLLCGEVVKPQVGGIELKNVVSAAKVADRFRKSPIDTVFQIDLPLWIVSQWATEFEVDRRVHQGTIQLLAPGGERVLQQYDLEFDCRDTAVFRFIHRIPDMRFVGLGTYEFHVVLNEFASIGEWGRACFRLS